MAEKGLRHLMQDALDGNLSPEMRRLLEDRLREDDEARTHYSGLMQVHAVLQRAPFERAPARLALRIMTRLAEEARKQQEVEADPSSLALAMSVALVTMTMMPMLVAASWLVVNAMARPEVLTRVMGQTMTILTIMMKTIQQLLDEAEALAPTDPEAARMVMALIPLTLLGFVDYMEENFTDQPGAG